MGLSSLIDGTPQVQSPLQLLAEATRQPGNHRDSSSSISSLISTLLPSIIFAFILFWGFIVLRKIEPRVYAPRTFIDTLREEEKTPKSGSSFFGWMKDFITLSDDYILNHQSLDGYLFVRFLKIAVIISLVGCCLTWPILLPVNATGGGRQTQLDRFSLSNVKDGRRYYAHALVAWIFFGALPHIRLYGAFLHHIKRLYGLQTPNFNQIFFLAFVMFVITRETVYLINLRQAYLLTPWNSSRISSRTVLFTAIPDEYLNEEALRRFLPSIKRVWFTTDYKSLTKMVEDRDETAHKLEHAEINLSKAANRAKLGAEKNKGPQSLIANQEDPHKWLTQIKRPTHRSRPIVGKKLDTIEHGRRHLAEIIPKIKKVQKDHMDGNAKLVRAAFVEFESQAAAQAASSTVVYNIPNAMVARQCGILPEEVIWDNLPLSSWETTIRYILATAFIIAMIAFWSIPVGFVGLIANVNNLTRFAWLKWINNIPTPLLGLITGLLPTTLLSILMSFVPIICRAVAEYAGAVTKSQVELQTQNWYFAFQVIQVFLLTTFTSGITAIVNRIVSDPTSVVDLLAKNLPKASNFYISYFIVNGVASSASYLFNVPEFLTTVVLSRFTARTPRQMFENYTTLTSGSFGSQYPKWTNFIVIAITYSCIAPLMLFFSTIGLSLIYFTYRYNYLYVYETKVDTKGTAYARALQQLTMGIYLAELCLLGLFGLRAGDTVASAGPSALMILLLLTTVLYHVCMRRALEPLTKSLPQNLLAESEEQGHEQRQSGEITEGLLASRDNEERAPRSNNIARLERGHDNYKSRFERFIHLQSLPATAIARSFHPCLHEAVPPYPAERAKKVYYNPTISSEPPKLWVVKDDIGVSREEIKETSKVIEITDQGANLDHKNNVIWDPHNLKEAPIWKENIPW